MKPTQSQKRARRLKRKQREVARPVTKDIFQMFKGTGHRPSIPRLHQRTWDFRKEQANKKANDIKQPEGKIAE